MPMKWTKNKGNPGNETLGKLRDFICHIGKYGKFPPLRSRCCHCQYKAAEECSTVREAAGLRKKPKSNDCFIGVTILIDIFFSSEMM